jgi:D-xylulose kinase
MVYLMGVDIGTLGTKGIIVDQNGNVISSAYREYDVLSPHPSWAEQWPDVWLKATLEVIKENVEKTGVKVDAIAISGLYGGSGIPVDRNMKPLRPCIIWMDRRAVKETEWVKENVPKDLLVSITGNYVDSYFGFTKILWIKNNEPEIWNKTYKFITPKDYVIYKLTGELAIDHSSAGNLGGLYDIRKRKWSEDMAKALGIPLEKLPERIVKSSDVVGRVKKEMSDIKELLEGTPVVAGGIDAPVAQLSAGVVDPGEHVVMLGTSMCWGTVHKGEKITPELVNYPYVVDEEELIYTFGGGATSGAIVRWFRDNFGKSYDELNKGAEKVEPGSEGLIVLPYFMGERSPIWDPKARGVVFGLTLKHGKYHVYRAFLEGVAFSLRHNMEFAKGLGFELSEKCFLVGGGAKSDLWTQILADITGYSMVRLKGNVEAPLGDAFLAGMGIGLFKDKHEIKSWIEIQDERSPRNFEVYDKLYEIYKKLYEKTRDLMWEL